MAPRKNRANPGYATIPLLFARHRQQIQRFLLCRITAPIRAVPAWNRKDRFNLSDNQDARTDPKGSRRQSVANTLLNTASLSIFSDSSCAKIRNQHESKRRSNDGNKHRDSAKTKNVADGKNSRNPGTETEDRKEKRRKAKAERYFSGGTHFSHTKIRRIR